MPQTSVRLWQDLSTLEKWEGKLMPEEIQHLKVLFLISYQETETDRLHPATPFTNSPWLPVPKNLVQNWPEAGGNSLHPTTAKPDEAVICISRDVLNLHC